MSKRYAFVNSEDCVACGACNGVCPREAVSVFKGCYAKVDTEKCVGCGLCEKICPANAIGIRVRDAAPQNQNDKNAEGQIKAENCSKTVREAGR